MPKLCKDCIHFKPYKPGKKWENHDFWASHECSKSSYPASINLVNGKVIEGGFRRCAVRRRDETSKCGPEGNQFVAANNAVVSP